MVFVFGAIIGSFLNVVIYRFNTGKSLEGRSHCLSCGHTLSWYELIPVVSYLGLRGHCRHCHASVPARYIFVEVGMGILFVLFWMSFSHVLPLFALYAISSAILVVIFVHDLRHMIIPDSLVVALGIVALVILSYITWSTGGGYMVALEHIGAGLGAGIFFFAFWFFSKGRAMGLGDAKLAIPLGIIVGPLGAPAMIIGAFWVGAIVSLVILAFQKVAGTGKTQLPFLRTPLKMKSEIPFAPFLILAFWYVVLFHADIYTLINLFVF